ncbi:MAG TPA: TIGR01777 family oxidoreductase [Blastocatellia bacterium]|nr:TIGR01777 family oxidoreductase [Blastocatellia bacterium]
MRILITGATGLIGRTLVKSLTTDGHHVVAVSRSPEKAAGLSGVTLIKWDPMSGPPPKQALESLDAVVNLAGESIADHRWSEAQKRRIRDSRIVTTRNLVEGILNVERKPRVLVSGSAVGYYGDRGDEQLEESAAPASGFLGELSQEWENEAARAREAGLRVVQVRTGVVLSTEGGALKKMLPAFKLGVAGPLASGRQWFPWIHIDDLVGIIRHAIASASMDEPVNGAAPGIVTNREFTRELARILHRPAFFSVPEFALRILMGEMADILIASQRVVPAVALRSGYEFRHALLEPALRSLF